MHIGIIIGRKFSNQMYNDYISGKKCSNFAISSYETLFCNMPIVLLASFSSILILQNR